MTNLEIMARALSEATGKSLPFWRAEIHTTAARLGISDRLAINRNERDTARLLLAFREEKAGILAWLLEGVLDANKKPAPDVPCNEQNSGNL